MQFSGRSEVGGKTAFGSFPSTLLRADLIPVRTCSLLIGSKTTFKLQPTAGGRYGDEFRPD